MLDKVFGAVEYICDLAVKLSSGMLTSVEIFVLTLLFSLPLGMIVAFGRMSKNRIIRGITKLYIAIMRGTPLMLQLLVVYFGPFYLFRIPLAREYRFIAVIIAFSINYAAYFAEIYRSGIESMPLGQYEAAKVLGYNKNQTFFKIILPQVIKRVIPPITNETITLVKDTSLANTISVYEIIWMGDAFMKGSEGIHGAIWPLFFTGVYFLLFNGILTVLLGRLEKKLDYFR